MDANQNSPVSNAPTKELITTHEVARRCGVPLRILVHALQREGIATYAVFTDEEKMCYSCWDESLVVEICQRCFGRLPVKELLETMDALHAVTK